jgi:carbamoyltransferase
MTILGINAYHGDVSAVLLRDGELVTALEEERFRRVKHWAGFPRDAVRACVAAAGIEPRDIDHFAVSRNPRANLFHKAKFTLLHHPSPKLVADRARNQARVGSLAESMAETLGLEKSTVEKRLHFVEHHPAHLASTFFVSPFEEATVCAIDGFGDFVSTSLAIGRRNLLDVRERIYFPHSLGMLYLAITQYLGFPKYGDEFKVMGLAPYGSADFVAPMRRLLKLKPDGGFELNLEYFCHWSQNIAMTWNDGEPTLGPVFTPKVEELLGPARDPKQALEPRHEAIAASLQVVFEEAAFHVLNGAYRKTGIPQLCLAGGCAMNSVANGKVRANTPFRDVYIQPAAGDNGTALGAAYYVWHQVLGEPRDFQMRHGYWGTQASEEDVKDALRRRQAEILEKRCTVLPVSNRAELCGWTAERIAEGKIVGWYQGRMEWGARALGNRSILADPRRPDMREIINTKIKFREKFRPFAPSILEEALDDYFVGAVPDPFMIQVYPVRPEKRAVIPAITHVDGSGRLQTVSRTTNPLYWELIRAFETRTGVPVLLNTSFNENEPIVNRPEEALDCFLRTNMDVIVMGNVRVEKPANS